MLFGSHFFRFYILQHSAFEIVGGRNLVVVRWAYRVVRAGALAQIDNAGAYILSALIDKADVLVWRVNIFCVNR